MTSPLTAPILTAQRAARRWKRYHLAISDPDTVLTARVNQATFDTLDNISELPIDGITGTQADVLQGMTVLIGSVSGGRDIGVLRAKSCAAGVLTFGAVSGFQFADDQHVTVLADWRVWAKQPVQSGGVTVAVDGDIEYQPAVSTAPIVRIGPHAAVLEAAGTLQLTATIESPAGYTAASYAWTVSGTATIDDDTAQDPVFTFEDDGQYYITCAVTDSVGGVTTVYRTVFVNPDTSAVFSLGEISGDVDSGGWSVQVEGFSGVTQSAIQDGALCVLWMQNYTSTARDTDYGPYDGFENVRLIGWVDGQSISINPEFGTLDFTIGGPAYFAQNTPGTPTTITPGAENWDTVYQLTTDSALRRLLFNSTLSDITNITLTGDTTAISAAVINSGSVYSQLDALAQEKLLARLLFDRFGCGYFIIPTPFLSSTPRSAIDTLYDIAKADWTDFTPGDRVTVAPSAMVEISAFEFDGTNDSEIYSRAPGNAPAQYGEIVSPYSGLAIASQAALNTLAGNIYAHDNNEYPGVDFEFAWANDYLDIAPSYILTADIAAGDTPLGIVWTNKRLCPLAVSFVFSPDTGAEYSAATFEAETDGADGVTYVPPAPVLDNIVDFPPPPGYDFDGGGWFPPILPPPLTDCITTTSRSLSWDNANLTSGQSAYSYFPCTLPGGQDSVITWRVGRFWGGATSSDVDFYGIDSNKNRIISGVLTGAGSFRYSVTFSPVGDTAIAGFELAFASGTGTDYIIGDVIASGTVLQSDGTGTSLNTYMEDGQVYACDSTGGPYLITVNPGALFHVQLITRDGAQNEITSYFLDNSGYSPNPLDFAPPAYSRRRIIFQYDSAYTWRVRVEYPGPGFAGSGSLGWLLRPAYTNFALAIGTTTITGVCP